jgi:hypothetical protein
VTRETTDNLYYVKSQFSDEIRQRFDLNKFGRNVREKGRTQPMPGPLIRSTLSADEVFTAEETTPDQLPL